MGFDLKYGKNSLWYGQFSHFPDDFMTHAVSTRFGGMSEGAFQSLNLAMHNGDDPAHVIENRRRFGQALALSADLFVTAQQVHGDAVLRVDTSFAGKGAQSYADAIASTDALITDCENLPLMLFFADCVPVLIVDPVKRAVGVSHAGWKGTVHGIVQKTVRAMHGAFGSKAADCLVGIAPSIGSCCYEVGGEVAARFQEAFPNFYQRILISVGEKYKLDLWAANRIQLEEIGVRSENIVTARACTACNSDVFFSYRADQGKTGRIAAVICLKKQENFKVV